LAICIKAQKINLSVTMIYPLRPYSTGRFFSSRHIWVKEEKLGSIFCFKDEKELEVLEIKYN